jgi:hypothetical protein
VEALIAVFDPHAPQDTSRGTFREVWKETKVDQEGKRGRVVAQHHHSIHHDLLSIKSPRGGQLKTSAVKTLDLLDDIENDGSLAVSPDEAHALHSDLPTSDNLVNRDEISEVSTGLPEMVLLDLNPKASNDSDQSEDLIEL